jgi:hypothetical protein
MPGILAALRDQANPGDAEVGGRLGVLRVLLLGAALGARLVDADAEVLAGGERCCGGGSSVLPWVTS